MVVNIPLTVLYVQQKNLMLFISAMAHAPAKGSSLRPEYRLKNDSDGYMIPGAGADPCRQHFEIIIICQVGYSLRYIPIPVPASCIPPIVFQ